MLSLLLADLRARFRLPTRTLLIATGIVAAGGVFLLMGRSLLGNPMIIAAYLTIMLLLAPSRRLTAEWQVAAAGWSVAVAVGGYLVGTTNTWVLVVAILVVSVVQSLFRFGRVATLTNSPVNLVLFAAMPQIDITLREAAIGAIAGAIVIIALGPLLRERSVQAVETDPIAVRIRSGLVLAVGCLILVGFSEATRFPHLSWALVSLCIILAVEVESRDERAGARIAGSVLGVLAASAAWFLPHPLPLVVAAVCAVLCLAYMSLGDYTLYVFFLTPAVMLTASGGWQLDLAVDRILAVLVAASVGLSLTQLGKFIGSRVILSREAAIGK